MPAAKVQEQETQSDFDTDSAVADISSDLFGQGSEEEAGEDELTEGAEGKVSDEPSVDAPEAPPQTAPSEVETPPAASEGDTSLEVQAIGAPKTWTKEALETWATIPERAQVEILKREEDFLKGITEYKGMADVGAKYQEVIAPYAPILAAEQVDPVQLIQSFAANHYLLTKGTPQQKIELAASMLYGYQIPLPELLNYIADQDLDLNPTDPRLDALQKQVTQLTNFISSAQTTTHKQTSDRIDAEIEKFAADPAHPYFNELADDIHKLFAGGMANTLAEAYDKALYANPTTRQKELERLTAEAKSSTKAEEKQLKKAKSTAADVILTPKTRDGTVPTGSIDDTLEETMAAIQSRG